MNKALIGTVTLLAASQFSWAGTIFDDFNTDKGHFNQFPTFSGSTSGLLSTSTNEWMTSDSPFEGIGQQKLTLNWNGSSTSIRVRELSGGGTPANNLSFSTSSGTDGWFGFFLKTTSANWTVQPWLEGASNNGGTPKNVIGDGQWHLYEWNLDDTSGGTDGWGNIAGIATGSATVADGNHTIDSIIFRQSTPSASSTIYFDFVAKSDSGSIANMASVPEPSALSLSLLGGFALAVRVISRRRSA